MKKTIELDITNEEYKKLAIFSAKQGMSIGEFFIKRTSDIFEDDFNKQYEYTTLLSFLLDDGTVYDLKDFLRFIDTLQEEKEILKDNELEFERIKVSEFYEDDEESRQQELEDMKKDIEHMTKEAEKTQAIIEETLDRYRKYNKQFDLAKEIKLCIEWLEDCFSIEQDVIKTNSESDFYKFIRNLDALL